MKFNGFVATFWQELLAYIKDLVEWEEPEYIRKNFPYYQTGYDMKGQPAWVGEFGKYDILKYLEVKTEDLEKYSLKSYVRVVESLHHATGHKMNADINAPKRISAIIDFDGLEIRQLGNRQGNFNFTAQNPQPQTQNFNAFSNYCSSARRLHQEHARIPFAHYRSGGRGLCH